MAAPVVTTLLSPNPASGSVSTDGTEQTIASATAAGGVFQLDLDCTNMQDGDAITLKVYKKVSSGGTQRLLDSAGVSNGGKAIVSFGPYSTYGDIKFTIQRTSGTDRAYPFGVLNFTGA